LAQLAAPTLSRILAILATTSSFGHLRCASLQPQTGLHPKYYHCNSIRVFPDLSMRFNLCASRCLPFYAHWQLTSSFFVFPAVRALSNWLVGENLIHICIGHLIVYIWPSMRREWLPDDQLYTVSRGQI